MKKKDFTIKGTKLPKIPKGSMYGEYIFTRSYKNLATKEYSNGIIYATSLDKDNNGFLVPVSLPLIERLAEEQGMLYEKEEQPPISTTPSLRDLLQQASVSEYVIRTGCQMFSGVDESERLKQVEQEWAKLRELVNTLQTILNKK